MKNFNDMYNLLLEVSDSAKKVLSPEQRYEYFSALSESYKNAKEGTQEFIVKQAASAVASEVFGEVRREKIAKIRQVLNGLTLAQASKILRDVSSSLDHNSVVSFSKQKTQLSRYVSELGFNPTEM